VPSAQSLGNKTFLERRKGMLGSFVLNRVRDLGEVFNTQGEPETPGEEKAPWAISAHLVRSLGDPHDGSSRLWCTEAGLEVERHEFT
jgi:hypothetical protein